MYVYQCPRCRGMNRYGWKDLLLHYAEEHPGVLVGKRG